MKKHRQPKLHFAAAAPHPALRTVTPPASPRDADDPCDRFMPPQAAPGDPFAVRAARGDMARDPVDAKFDRAATVRQQLDRVVAQRLGAAIIFVCIVMVVWLGWQALPALEKAL